MIAKSESPHVSSRARDPGRRMRPHVEGLFENFTDPRPGRNGQDLWYSFRGGGIINIVSRDGREIGLYFGIIELLDRAVAG